MLPCSTFCLAEDPDGQLKTSSFVNNKCPTCLLTAEGSGINFNLRLAKSHTFLLKLYDVSMTSCHHCRMNKLSVTVKHIYKDKSARK